MNDESRPKLTPQQRERRLCLAAQLDTLRGAIGTINLHSAGSYGLTDAEYAKLKSAVEGTRDSVRKGLEIAWASDGE